VVVSACTIANEAKISERSEVVILWRSMCTRNSICSCLNMIFCLFEVARFEIFLPKRGLYCRLQSHSRCAWFLNGATYRKHAVGALTMGLCNKLESFRPNLHYTESQKMQNTQFPIGNCGRLSRVYSTQFRN